MVGLLDYLENIFCLIQGYSADLELTIIGLLPPPFRLPCAVAMSIVMEEKRNVVGFAKIDDGSWLALWG